MEYEKAETRRCVQGGKEPGLSTSFTTFFLKGDKKARKSTPKKKRASHQPGSSVLLLFSLGSSPFSALLSQFPRPLSKDLLNNRPRPYSERRKEKKKRKKRRRQHQPQRTSEEKQKKNKSCSGLVEHSNQRRTNLEPPKTEGRGKPEMETLGKERERKRD